MISILIISYGRKNELIETLKCISEYSGDTVELLFLDNNEFDHLKEDVERVFNNNPDVNLKYFHDGINYGVAKGRNYLIERAKGDILITLDDDLYIEDINILVKKVSEYFYHNENLGTLAFNIKNFYTKNALRHEIPHGNKSLDFSNNMLTYYFIGAGHAIKKDVYEKVGLYPLDLGMYGGEERDLSFRIIDNNFDILYSADIIIYHKVSPNGRMAKVEENFYRYRNQLIVVNRYMPFIYSFTSNVVWSLFYLFIKKGKLKDVYRVIKEVYSLRKQCISKDSLLKIKKLDGRLFY